MRKDQAMSNVSNAAGHAALAICESMLLSLTDSKVIDEAEAKSILADAATAHRNAIPMAADGTAHDEAASLIEAIIKGGISVRKAT
jgi:predicted metal-dependent phosphotriesterase family hydrolase